MHYEIRGENGKVLVVAATWDELMKKYNPCRKASKTPIKLEKVEEEDESN